MDEARRARLTAWLRDAAGDATLALERAALLSGGAIQQNWALDGSGGRAWVLPSVISIDAEVEVAVRRLREEADRTNFRGVKHQRVLAGRQITLGLDLVEHEAVASAALVGQGFLGDRDDAARTASGRPRGAEHVVGDPGAGQPVQLVHRQGERRASMIPSGWVRNEL